MEAQVFSNFKTFLSKEEVEAIIREADNKLEKVCHQIVLLNNIIEDLLVWYNRSESANSGTFQYSLRLRLVSLQMVRDVFHKYAVTLADDLDDFEVQESGLTTWDDTHHHKLDNGPSQGPHSVLKEMIYAIALAMPLFLFHLYYWFDSTYVLLEILL